MVVVLHEFMGEYNQDRQYDLAETLVVSLQLKQLQIKLAALRYQLVSQMKELDPNPNQQQSAFQTVARVNLYIVRFVLGLSHPIL